MKGREEKRREERGEKRKGGEGKRTEEKGREGKSVCVRVRVTERQTEGECV